MPRTARASVAKPWYHVLNRGNRREAIFHKPADNDAFVKAIADARTRLPTDILGYCLMPNHVYLVIRTHADGELEPERGTRLANRPPLWPTSSHAS
jgi:putative transposase